jgi:hypothetical protein
MYKNRRMRAAGNALEMSAVCGFGGVGRPAPNKVGPGRRSSPRIDDWSCGALVRGFVGSPRIPDEEYFFLPERLVQAGLRECGSLRKLCEWAHNKPYLPVEGRDFRMYPDEVTSPSDIHVRFWKWEEIANHAASAHQ